MESNKSIHRSDEQNNLYKALVDAYESDKLILDTYGDTVSFKDEEMIRIKTKNPPLDQTGGSKRRPVGKEPELTSTPKEKKHPSQQASQLKGPKLFTSLLASLLMQRIQCTPPRIWNNLPIRSLKLEILKINQLMRPLSLLIVQPWLSNLARVEGPCESFNELMDTPLDFSAFMMNRLKVDTITPELLAGPTFELMKGTCKSLVELEYFFEKVYKETTDQLDWNNPEGQQYPHDLRKPLPLIPNSRGCQVILFDHFINNDLAYLFGGVLSRTYATSVTKTQAADYGHIKWIEDLVPNTIWSEVQLGVEIYQKKLKTTNSDMYRSNLKRRDAYTAYSNPRGFIYQNKDKKNKLMRIDELHNFSDGTLDDVRTALNNRLKGIRMEYLPQTI
ncbi:hypothetical protein Tco_1355935 [Tanacetum coccineum]